MELSNMTTNELAGQVDDFFARFIKSLCDCGGDHQNAVIVRDAWQELARRCASMDGALDECYDWFEPVKVGVAQDDGYMVSGEFRASSCPNLSAEIARRKNT